MTDDTTIASAKDFFVTRDDDDNLQAIEQKLPGVEEKIRVYPMTLGDLNKYGADDGQLDPSVLDNDELAELFNNHLADIADDDDFEVTADIVEADMIGFGKDALITAILRASGYDLQNAINMENLEMLQKIDDPGKLQALMEFAQNQND